MQRSMPTTKRPSRHDRALCRFGRTTELPGRKKHASVSFTLNLCCQNVFLGIIISKSRCENKTVGKNKPVSNCCHGRGTAKSLKTRETHG